ncbi:heme-binding protein [Actinomadura decatromicini]|uniref:Heme-binding protein n=1 Tax=Actinomadura decatromicini TaxID=2604572 RepID=A0A5D3FZJ0_9ACTN|nr:heme-binding protein [Actinomadura decatromicini]TYK53140.1 heme-binding protein [Actinomadura decatromicini]
MSYRHFIAGVAALGIVTAGGVGTAVADTSALAAVARTDHGPFPVDHVLSNKSLVRAAAALVEAAEREGDQRVTMVIMERSGVIREVVRTRKAGPQTYESAKRKAYTAVAFGRPTSELTDNATVNKIPGTLTLPGGVPVVYRGFPIAGIGVGGAPDGRIDERIANAVLNAIYHSGGRKGARPSAHS